MKVLKIFISTLLISVLLSFLYIFQPWVYLPHERISIILPFSNEVESTVGLIPMGEMIEHNKENGNPDGHPGIDFGFNGVTKIISSSDGIVVQAGKSEYGSMDVVIQSGFYKIAYKELNSIDEKIKLFSKVEKGQLLGYVGTDNISMDKPKQGDPSRQIHWEFLSASMFIDRLCPLEYFEKDSRDRINMIWERVDSNSQFKKEYPNICSGVFEGKVD